MVQDADIYANNGNYNQNWNQTAENFETSSHHMNHSDALQNRMQNRPKTNKNSLKKMGIMKSSESNYSLHNTDDIINAVTALAAGDEPDATRDRMGSKSQTEYQQGWHSKMGGRKRKQPSNGSSIGKATQLPDAY